MEQPSGSAVSTAENEPEEEIRRMMGSGKGQRKQHGSKEALQQGSGPSMGTVAAGGQEPVRVSCLASAWK